MRSTRCHSSAVMSTNGADPPMPAFAKHASTRPSAVERRGEGLVDRRLVADVAHERDDACAVYGERRTRRGVLVGVRAPETDVGAGLCERLGHAEADAAVAAGDQRDFAGEIEGGVGHAPMSQTRAPVSTRAVAGSA